MTETIRTVMALHGLYPDLISNALRVQDVYGDSRSYCVRCGRTWTSHVTWIKLDLRSQRVLKNWKQPCLDCGQEVSPYITADELERMVNIAVERCLEMIEDQKAGASAGAAMPSGVLQRRRRSAEMLAKEGEPERSSAGNVCGEVNVVMKSAASPAGKGYSNSNGPTSPTARHSRSSPEPSRTSGERPDGQPQAIPLHHAARRPFHTQWYSLSSQTSPTTSNVQMPALYTAGLVPVHVFYDQPWSSQPPAYPVPITYNYTPAANADAQQVVWSPPMPVCCS